MAQLTIGNSNTQHYVCTTTTKPPSTSKVYADFKKRFFKRSKNWNTPFYLQMFCALSGRSLSWNNPVFSRFTSREHANFTLSHSCASSSFKDAAPKVLWEKVISRRSKQLKSDPGLGLGAMLKMWVTSSYIQFWFWPGLTITILFICPRKASLLSTRYLSLLFR